DEKCWGNVIHDDDYFVMKAFQTFFSFYNYRQQKGLKEFNPFGKENGLSFTKIWR
ncbi:15146_t:CDS:2, partial [Funneliformis mosseae]